MPKKKKYYSFLCRNCDIDFYVSKRRKRIYCPHCSDYLFVELKCSLWMERPFNYKRPWTEEEDSIILDGARLGYSRKEIAESLNDRTTKAVIRRLSQLRKKGVLTD